MFSCKLNDLIELRLLEARYARTLFHTVDRNRDYLYRWLPWVEYTETADDMKALIEFDMNRFAENDGFSAGIFEQGNVIGVVSFQEIDWRHRKTSIAYWLSEDRQGRGIMTAACTEMVHYAMITLELNRVEIRARVDNARSRAIPERLGFTQEGVLRQEEYSGGRYHDHAVYGMLADEWKARTVRYRG
ncbi:GNAT family N-acetyltransferase [Paenibacillus beijingensis]|uniref:N-acetyltransferase domain-containing protein n=1 Tax=Paenibacillus beijingensis TaxID=1126833 RepID=A0A0D5NPX3_9BACL|nr:GNAT family N-acetyltransferase [Paenibacillus beijingensis]AJY77306.1 hypothetical protein VN24_25540 [Paenibacillus beijingensis]